MQMQVLLSGASMQEQARLTEPRATVLFQGHHGLLMRQLLQVFLVKQMMEQEGVDLMLDVHGDEDLPYNFISGNEGIPGWTPRLAQLQVHPISYFLFSTPGFMCLDLIRSSKPLHSDLEDSPSRRVGVAMPQESIFQAFLDWKAWSSFLPVASSAAVRTSLTGRLCSPCEVQAWLQDFVSLCWPGDLQGHLPSIW